MSRGKRARVLSADGWKWIQGKPGIKIGQTRFIQNFPEFKGKQLFKTMLSDNKTSLEAHSNDDQNIKTKKDPSSDLMGLLNKLAQPSSFIFSPNQNLVWNTNCAALEKEPAIRRVQIY